nr:unnamed protein product [Callosobruchus chinensis]
MEAFIQISGQSPQGSRKDQCLEQSFF